MNRNQRITIGTWLLAGVFMIFIQVLLGGITRLTGSGLSITQWDVIMGALPPLNQQEWNHAFDLYKQTPQFKIMNSDISLSGFKVIFFWEYLHRLWARLFVPAFLIPLIYFLWKKMIDRQLLFKVLIAFVLGGLQGLMGWIMVSSGLVDQPWVSPIDLSAHLILALILYGYLFWIALQVLQPPVEDSPVFFLRRFSYLITAIIFLQIFYGGLMAGNHATLFYPTFPKFGSDWIPAGLMTFTPVISNFFQNIAMIQLIHRSLGILIGILILIFFTQARRKNVSALFRNALNGMLALVVTQIALGILTLLNSLGKIPVALAEAHQITGLLLLTVMLFLNFQLSFKKSEITRDIALKQVLLEDARR